MGPAYRRCTFYLFLKISYRRYVLIWAHFWGGFESLALYQGKREQGNRQYLKLANDEHLVRLHIGLEDPKDLIDDLKKSLKHIK